MKKMTKIAIVLLSLACAVCTYAGADTLTACGVPGGGSQSASLPEESAAFWWPRMK